MSTDRWTASHTAVYNINFRIIWCPKYRRPVLVDQVENRLKALLHEKADGLGISIQTMEVMPDHVHLFVSSPSTLAPHYIVGQLKGYTSRILRKEFPSLNSRLPSLWTRSYYIESVGHLSEATIRQYIEDQKNV